MKVNFTENAAITTATADFKRYLGESKNGRDVQIEVASNYIEFEYDEEIYEIKQATCKSSDAERYVVITYSTYIFQSTEVDVNISNVVIFDSLIKAYKYVEDRIIKALLDTFEEDLEYKSIDTSIIPDQHTAMDRDIF